MTVLFVLSHIPLSYLLKNIIFFKNIDNSNYDYIIFFYIPVTVLYVLCSHNSILSSSKPKEGGTIPIPVLVLEEMGAQTSNLPMTMPLVSEDT